MEPAASIAGKLTIGRASVEFSGSFEWQYGWDDFEIQRTKARAWVSLVIAALGISKCNPWFTGFWKHLAMLIVLAFLMSTPSVG